MSMHFRSLLFKSAQIQQRIDAERTHHAPDLLRLMRLTILRLRTKDRLRRLVAAARRHSPLRIAGSPQPMHCAPGRYAQAQASL